MHSIMQQRFFENDVDMNTIAPKITKSWSVMIRVGALSCRDCRSPFEPIWPPILISVSDPFYILKKD